ncbi:MAG TPA: ATP-binding protein [Nostocaceae cyanobacterium]|nr:ATP-binding protein [Nostocaceae cyanobacterium]
MKNELLNGTELPKSYSLEWQATNHHDLMQALEEVRNLLKNPDIGAKGSLSSLSNDNALDTLSQIFNLSDFERSILLLCLGMEFDPNWGYLCSNARGGHPTRPYPTFSVAMSIFSDTHWTAFAPTSPLRKWRLINVGEAPALILSPLKIDERILHYLFGENNLDERLRGVIEPLVIYDKIDVPSHQQLAAQMAKTWEKMGQGVVLPVIQLCGEEVNSKRAIASTVCQLLDIDLHMMSVGVIAGLRSSEINDLLSLWEREAVLYGSALLLDCDDIDTSDPNKENIISRLMESITTPIMISSLERRRSHQRPIINVDVQKPSTEEQRHIWYNILGQTADHLNGYVDTLVSHFNLSAAAIQTVCVEAKGKMEKLDETPLSTILWDTCRSQARPRLHELAQPIEPGAGWDDLVLPENQRQVLKDISAHVRQRMTVYERWGFGKKGSRGLGISALFAGASGTGKTMAAEVIANELRLDLYRIDLSQVVSKYIGETEKNLRRVFDAAEYGGAILLFDEADALFGKRSEVKDSHDRHANIEVGYLLQRMEAYRGLAILTTNLKSSLDQAFLRRIRFIVQFPFPDATQRAEIWQRIFPSRTPTQDLDPELLAKLNVSGGNIRNIALNAAFLAADAGEPVQMKHLLQAAKSEYAKLERPLTDAEVKGWV